MKIVDFSLKKRVTMSMVVLVIVILGMISFTKLGLDMLPDMDYPYITVITTYGGVSSEDIEQNITRPVEQWISTVSGIKDCKSVSLEGNRWSWSNSNGGSTSASPPRTCATPSACTRSSCPTGPTALCHEILLADAIIAYGITGGNMSLSKLRDYVDNEVATRLERIEGVASTAVFSPEMDEVLVSIDKGKLESRGLNIGQVEGDIQASNVNLPAGYMTENHKGSCCAPWASSRPFPKSATSWSA
jgi:HAE1 family hydrophobic/amphiphilic exporter-1